MPEIDIIINHPEGLHARPAAQLVKTAQQFQADITISMGNWKADAKSILEILTLGANQGSEIYVSAEGEDAEQAIEAIRELIETNFGDELDEPNKPGKQKDIQG